MWKSLTLFAILTLFGSGCCDCFGYGANSGLLKLLKQFGGVFVLFGNTQLKLGVNTMGCKLTQQRLGVGTME